MILFLFSLLSRMFCPPETASTNKSHSQADNQPKTKSIYPMAPTLDPEEEALKEAKRNEPKITVLSLKKVARELGEHLSHDVSELWYIG